MKRFAKFILIVWVFSFHSCMDYFPTDELEAEQLMQDTKGMKYIMDGCYAVLKDQVEYLGYASGNDYCRHYLQMSEYPSDNVCLSGHTPDPLYQALTYTMTDDLKNVGTLWMLAYKVIGMCNTVIESKSASQSDQMVGEAYFMRALMHLHMVTLYAKPYVMGRDNVGVPLSITSGSTTVTRASVGAVYDQIVQDLLKAAELLGDSRGNAGYPCHDAALGLLSRVYLYRGEYQKVIDVVDEALDGADISTKLESSATFSSYFANAKTSVETLFCIAHETTDNKGQASIGSMYNGDGGGWGEVYPSNPLLYLYERYPSDLRYTAYIVPQYPLTRMPDLYVYFPNANTTNTFYQPRREALLEDEGGYYFEDTEGKIYLSDRLVQGEYHEWWLTYQGVDYQARVHEAMKTRTSDPNPQWFVTKFGYQDDMPQLSSPVFLRWAEVLLNRAEAYAQLHNDERALADVNILRKRANIPQEGMFASDQMHGYTSVLDVVLDERRMELAFEGHRMFDMIRNKRNMDRRYTGVNPWEIVPYDRPHMQYPIPFSEWSVSGIAQNPGY